MMKAFATLALASAVVFVAPEAHALESIDLRVPGNLEAIERDRPDHFAKIQRILAGVPRQPPSAHAVATWMRAQFDARNIRYHDLVMTSLPPKKRLEFSLDDTAYVAVVTLTSWGAEVVPVPSVARAK